MHAYADTPLPAFSVIAPDTIGLRIRCHECMRSKIPVARYRDSCPGNGCSNHGCCQLRSGSISSIALPTNNRCHNASGHVDDQSPEIAQYGEESGSKRGRSLQHHAGSADVIQAGISYRRPPREGIIGQCQCHRGCPRTLASKRSAKHYHIPALRLSIAIGRDS